MSEITETVIEMPAGHEQNIFGQLDANLKKIEHSLGVTVTARDGSVRIEGSREAVVKTRQLFDMLLAISYRSESRLFSVPGEPEGNPGAGDGPANEGCRQHE